MLAGSTSAKHSTGLETVEILQETNLPVAPTLAELKEPTQSQELLLVPLGSTRRVAAPE
jgi:hypothetical protein